MLESIMLEAGLDPQQCLYTNVISAHPRNNDFSEFLHPISSKKPDFYGVHAKPELLSGLENLRRLISIVQPKLIIGCGNIPLWALTDKASVATSRGFRYPGGITSWRGSQLRTRIDMGGVPFLPIIHPSAITKMYGWRHPTVHDLKSRAARFLTDRLEWENPTPPVAIPRPSFKQVSEELHTLLAHLRAGIEVDIAADLETWRRRWINCIGFSWQPTAGTRSPRSMCIGLFDFDDAGHLVDRYTEDQEWYIWLYLKEIFSHPLCRVIGQYFQYDAQFFWRVLRLRVIPTYDTMVMHHLLFPGTPKSLDYLASLYSNHYVYWKDESQDWNGKLDTMSLWTYNCKDTLYTLECGRLLRRLVERAGMSSHLNERMEDWITAYEMEITGFGVDLHRRAQYHSLLKAQLQEHHDYLMASVPEDLQLSEGGAAWYNSSPLSKHIFYEILAIQPILHKKTKQPTLDKEALPTLEKRAPYLKNLFKVLKQTRQIQLFISTFIEMNLRPWDQRFCPTFNIVGTDTTRWSSSTNGFGEGTNGQNIPQGTED
jgi:hypothetical protein